MSRSENTRVAARVSGCARRARCDDRESSSEGVGTASTRAPSHSHLNHRGRGAHCGEGGLIVSRRNLEAVKRPSSKLVDRDRQLFIARGGPLRELDLSVGAAGGFVRVTVSVARADRGLALASIARLMWGVVGAPLGGVLTPTGRVAALVRALAIASPAADTSVVRLDEVDARVPVSWRPVGMGKRALAGAYARAEIDHATPIAELATRMPYAA